MLKSHEDLSNEIEKICRKNISNKELQKTLFNILEEQYNIPVNTVSDIVLLRTPAIQFSDYILFRILYEWDDSKIKSYFTESEIDSFKNRKMEIKKFKFPIRLDMTKISDSQYLGVVELSQIIEWKNAQLIRYNENTQRTLKRFVANGVEMYKQSVNKAQVKEIKESMANNTYIADVLTFNLSEDAEFYYDKESHELVIKETSVLDIVDGFHRYIAMSALAEENDNFNIIMGCQIIYFSEEKAQQMIFQYDQKTKMDKVDSASFDQNNPGNRVVNKLKEKPTFSEVINTRDYIIDQALMSQIINVLYFNKKNKVTNKDIIEVRNVLYTKLNDMFDNYPEVLSKRWSIKFTIACLFLCKESNNDNLFTETLSLVDEIDDNKYSQYYGNSREFTTTKYTKLKKIYSDMIGGGRDV